MSPPSAPARSSLPAPRAAPAAAPGPRLTPLPAPALAPEERLAADVAAALDAAGCGPVSWSCAGEGCQVFVTVRFTAADAGLHVLDAVARRHRAAVARASSANGVASATLLLARGR